MKVPIPSPVPMLILETVNSRPGGSKHGSNNLFEHWIAMGIPLTYLDIPLTYLDVPLTYLDIPLTYLDVPLTYLDNASLKWTAF